MSEIPELDPIVHAPLRLSALTILSGADHVDFSYLKQLTGSSDGNLSVHMGKLEQAGYVKSKKQFVGRKPRTSYRITPAGRNALLKYVRGLKQILTTNQSLAIR